MNPKADTDHGWFKVADELAEALTRTELTAVEYAVVLWLLCHTYGVKDRRGKEIHARKTTPYSYYQVANETGRARSNIRRSINHLLKAGIIKDDGKGLGFNTRLEDWKKRPSGRSFAMGIKGATGPRQTGTQADRDPGSHGYPGPAMGTQAARARDPGSQGPGPGGSYVSQTEPSYARAQMMRDVERDRERERGLSAQRPPTSFGDLKATETATAQRPHGPDTALARAKAARRDLDPREAPDYGRLSFDDQELAVRSWRSSIEYREMVEQEKRDKERLRKQGFYDPVPDGPDNWREILAATDRRLAREAKAKANAKGSKK